MTDMSLQGRLRSAQVSLVAVLMCLSSPVAAAASHGTTLYQYKNWDVQIVTWDDGTSACVAEVYYDNGDSFSVWKYKDATTKLQFYSPSWNFGDNGGTANLQVQIDGRQPWNLNDADLYKNSVLFTLPNKAGSGEFLSDVTYGNTLFLRDESGKDVTSYSLSGSQASLSALDGCLQRLH
ncbi:hypothetical protein [Solirhodobacter olei]|uniref:hypothetical protein n=1 Tax=Solirhodobacter olei TaxID=2493082 RepID=UPI000FDA85BB|nr:hypothetical protein [Solirhodobacter olei]